MDHADHVNLIKNGVDKPEGLWADFGSGNGAFFFALLDLISGRGEIYSIDKKQSGLEKQRKKLESLKIGSNCPKLYFMHADINSRIYIPELDGAILANVLHFYKDKTHLIQNVLRYQKTGGKFILVEYNIDTGNSWVTFPTASACSTNSSRKWSRRILTSGRLISSSNSADIWRRLLKTSRT